VYIRYSWQGNYQIYGHIRCIYTVMTNPKQTPRYKAGPVCNCVPAISFSARGVAGVAGKLVNDEITLRSSKSVHAFDILVVLLQSGIFGMVTLQRVLHLPALL